MSHAEQQGARDHDVTSVDQSVEPSHEPIESSTFGEGELARPHMEQWLGQHSLAGDMADTTGTSGAYDDGVGHADPLGDSATVHADTKQVQAPAKDAVTELLKKTPTTTRGNNGYAAWLLEAIRLGFVSVAAISKPQLEDLVAGRPVRTYEYHHKVTKQDEERRKRDTKGKLDNVQRVPDREWEWSIDVKEAPILETLVAVAKARITEWRRTGGERRVMLKLGDFMRADMWYTPKNPAAVPPHEPGTAMDLRFVGNPNSEDYVLQLLQDLPAGGTVTTFRDTDDTLHLDRRSSGYGLGIPAKGDFIPAENAIGVDGRCPAQKAAELDAGGDQSRTLEAKGVVLFSDKVQRSTATWTNGKWQWTPWAVTQESLVSYIRSHKVRDAINGFGRKAPKGP